jgi:hypothetical protein
MSKKITIEIELVQRAEGGTDFDATMEQAGIDVRSYMAAREQDEEVIKSALDNVFDSKPGVKMNMPYVINQALAHMGISEQPTNYKVLYDRVHAFIVANAQGKTDKETKTVERPESYFVTGKGKGGGVARRADLASKADVEAIAES